MNEKREEKLRDKPTLKSGVIPRIIVAIVAILLIAMGVILQAYMPVVQFLAIVAACMAVILILLWLPEQTSKYTTKYLEYIDARLRAHIKITQDHREEIHFLRNRMEDLCGILIDGTPDRFSWEYFWKLVRDLKDDIVADTTFQPDIVLSIGRSGAIVGAFLATNMDTLMHIGIDRINDWRKQDSKLYRTVQIIPSPTVFSKELEGRNILCVMSECNTGMTLRAVREELDKIKGIQAIKEAVLFRTVTSMYFPAYVGEEDKGDRPGFPFRSSGWDSTSRGPASSSGE